MSVVWRCVVVLLAVAGCTGQVAVPITFEENNGPLRRNDACIERSAERPLEGVCQPMEECPLAIRLYEEGQPMLTDCGFEGVTRIVCCVDEGPPLEVHPDGTVHISANKVDISPPELDFECGSRPPEYWAALNAFLDRVEASRRPPVQDGSGIVAAGAVGGKISYPNSWPWTALMGWSRPDGSMWWRCGGALINRRWIVTAAHCFDREPPEVIRLGEHDYSNATGPFRQDFKIRRYLLHPDYSITAAYHDLALVELDRPVELKPQVSPVCLAWGRQSLANLIVRDMMLTGWGATQHGGDLSPVIQEVGLSVFKASTCDTNYRALPAFELDFPNGISSRDFVCAGDVRGGKDACGGDSGSPLTYDSYEVQAYVLAGVVSKGYGCGLKDFPGLYTPLHRGDYLSWIKKTAFT